MGSGWGEPKGPAPLPPNLLDALGVAPRLLLIGAAMMLGARRPEAEALAAVVMAEYADAPVTVDAAHELMRRLQELAGRVGT